MAGGGGTVESGVPFGHSGAGSPPKAPGDCFIPPEPELYVPETQLLPLLG